MWRIFASFAMMMMLMVTMAVVGRLNLGRLGRLDRLVVAVAMAHAVMSGQQDSVNEQNEREATEHREGNPRESSSMLALMIVACLA